MQNLGNNLLFFKFFMGMSIEGADFPSGLFSFDHKGVHFLQSAQYSDIPEIEDVILLKIGCLGMYVNHGIHRNDEFSHVTQILGRILQLEKNIDEILVNIEKISNQSDKKYKEYFVELASFLQIYSEYLNIGETGVQAKMGEVQNQVAELI